MIKVPSEILRNIVEFVVPTQPTLKKEKDVASDTAITVSLATSSSMS